MDLFVLGAGVRIAGDGRNSLHTIRDGELRYETYRGHVPGERFISDLTYMRRNEGPEGGLFGRTADLELVTVTKEGSDVVVRKSDVEVFRVPADPAPKTDGAADFERDVAEKLANVLEYVRIDEHHDATTSRCVFPQATRAIVVDWARRFGSAGPVEWEVEEGIYREDDDSE